MPESTATKAASYTTSWDTIVGVARRSFRSCVNWEPIPPPDRSWQQRPDLAHRTDTVERPALRNPDDDRH